MSDKTEVETISIENIVETVNSTISSIEATIYSYKVLKEAQTIIFNNGDFFLEPLVKESEALGINVGVLAVTHGCPNKFATEEAIKAYEGLLSKWKELSKKLIMSA